MSGVKCTNKRKLFCIAFALIFSLSFLAGCGDAAFSFSYDADYGVSTFQVTDDVLNASRATPFAQDLCIVTTDVANSEINVSQAGAALLCDVNGIDVIYAQNVHDKMHPASLTKVMTALVAMKYGSMDQVLTATSSVYISESGAQLLGLKPGDTMTLAQALHILLMYSANDVAMLIAEGVAGDVDSFLALMNEEAKALGATNTNFMNPHGLTQDNHYTTAYDVYLMFNEAIKYETFREIIHMSSYSTVYYDKNGKEKEVDIRTTNRFLREADMEAPDNVTVVGGKTGTTNAAGHCLVLLTRDTSGAPYISVLMRSPTSDDLYYEMSDLLSEIGK